MIAIRTIYQALLQYYDYDRQQALSDYQNLYVKMLTEPINTRKELHNIYVQEAQEHNICPKCLTYLEPKTIILNRMEYQGRQVEETKEQMICPECGFHF